MPKEIKVGELAFVRVSHEPVFTLAIEGDIAHTRRFVGAQQGAFYTYEDFTLPELMAEDPSKQTFEALFKTEEGEIAIAGPADSLLQN